MRHTLELRRAAAASVREGRVGVRQAHTEREAGGGAQLEQRIRAARAAEGAWRWRRMLPADAAALRGRRSVVRRAVAAVVRVVARGATARCVPVVACRRCGAALAPAPPVASDGRAGGSWPSAQPRCCCA